MRSLSASVLLAAVASCGSDSTDPDTAHATPAATAIVPVAAPAVPVAEPRGKPGEPSARCTSSVRASNELLGRAVLAFFPADALRRIEKLKPADALNCDPDEGPDFGGVSAQWDGISGAEAATLLAEGGWTRHNPATGPPEWETDKLPHGNGNLNYEPGDRDLLEFTATREDKNVTVGLTQDGLRAGIE